MLLVGKLQLDPWDFFQTLKKGIHFESFISVNTNNLEAPT